MLVGVAPKDYVAVIAAMLLLRAETIWVTDSKTFGKYKSLRYQNM